MKTAFLARYTEMKAKNCSINPNPSVLPECYNIPDFLLKWMQRTGLTCNLRFKKTSQIWLKFCPPSCTAQAPDNMLFYFSKSYQTSLQPHNLKSNHLGQYLFPLTFKEAPSKLFTRSCSTKHRKEEHLGALPPHDSIKLDQMFHTGIVKQWLKKFDEWNAKIRRPRTSHQREKVTNHIWRVDGRNGGCRTAWCTEALSKGEPQIDAAIAGWCVKYLEEKAKERQRWRDNENAATTKRKWNPN